MNQGEQSAAIAIASIQNGMAWISNQRYVPGASIGAGIAGAMFGAVVTSALQPKNCPHCKKPLSGAEASGANLGFNNPPSPVESAGQAFLDSIRRKYR